MPINTEALGIKSGSYESSWISKDALLYALGIGAGASDPTGFELEFTTENTAGPQQRVFPTFAVIPPFGGGGLAKHFGTYDKAKLVHAEQSIELHRPLPPSGNIVSESEITGMYDKGSAAVIETTTVSVDAADHMPMFTLRQKVFIRDEGGWGGDRGPASPPGVPERAADHVVAYQTRPDQALLYRLNGDRNPLHSDPSFAARGGFPKPILHGLCTYGFTGRALLHALCGSDPARFTMMSARFSKPVIPGDTLSVHIWVEEPGRAAFRTQNQDGSVVIDNGWCSFSV